ncbi:lysophospholipid acyltransferase family protein [Natronospora cellulosivora (SeqCode)]
MLNSIFKSLKLYLYPKMAFLLNLVSYKMTRIEIYGQEKARKIEENNSVLYALWHGKLWLPVCFFRNSSYVALASSSQDGEYIARVLEKYGYQLVRGSSSRSGGRALLKLIKKIREGNSVFITTDGPKGPIHKLKPGIVFLQEKTAAVIIPIGVAIKKKKTFSTWDRFIMPYPASRAVIYFGDALKLSSEKSLKEKTFEIEQAINKADRRAEAYLDITS